MTNYKYYNYADTGKDLTHKPLNTHLFIESTTDILYYVDYTDQTLIYKYVISTNTETLIKDVATIFQCAYHDRTNNLIYWGCANREVFKQDLTDDSFTQLGIAGLPGDVYDVFKIGTTIYALNIDHSGDTEVFIHYWDGDSWEIVATYTGGAGGASPFRTSFVVIIGTTAYFLWFFTGANTILEKFDSVAETITAMEDLGANTQVSSNKNLCGITYDNSDILSFIIYYTGDSKNYYCTYVISTDTFAKKGEFNVALMLDRNCNTSNNIPFNLEKGFNITLDKVYQISRTRENLYLISVQNFDDIIIAISDTYLVTDAKTLYKYQNMMAYITVWWTEHSKEDYPVAEILLRSNYISVARGMLMQLIGYYTAYGNAMYYKHSPDSFNDETPKAITLAGDIAWIDYIYLPNTCTCNLISEYDGHKNVLQLTHDAGTSDPNLKHYFDVAQTTGIYEFWFGVSDNTQDLSIRLNDDSHQNIIIGLDAGKFATWSGGVWIDSGITATNDTLFHHKISFNCTTDLFDWYINDVLVGNDIAFSTVATSLTRVYLDLESNAIYSLYLSAPGEVWDADYVEGDNQYVSKGMPDQVVFEGIVKTYDAKTLKAVRVESPAKEMDQVKPSGSKAGRTDEIITDMSNDLNGISYISMGTLSVGAAMGTLTLGGDKTWRTLINNFKDMDTFTWYLKPTGELNYDNGEVSTSVAFRYDGTTYFNHIEDANGFYLTSDVNQVIVRGMAGIESEATHGISESEQQIQGVILFILRDASLNTVALCNSKADAMIARSSDIATIDVVLDLGDIGFVQPGQTFLFKFYTTDVSITEDTFTIDRVKFEAKSEETIIEASNGLMFEW